MIIIPVLLIARLSFQTRGYSVANQELICSVDLMTNQQVHSIYRFDDIQSLFIFIWCLDWQLSMFSQSIMFIGLFLLFIWRHKWKDTFKNRQEQEGRQMLTPFKDFNPTKFENSAFKKYSIHPKTDHSITSNIAILNYSGPEIGIIASHMIASSLHQ